MPFAFFFFFAEEINILSVCNLTKMLTKTVQAGIFSRIKWKNQTGKDLGFVFHIFSVILKISNPNLTTLQV